MAVHQPLGNPSSNFDAADARRIMLDVISELSHGNDPNLQIVPVLREVARRLNCREGLLVEHVGASGAGHRGRASGSDRFRIFC